MTQQVIEIAIEIILILLGLYLAFVKSYFHEKGKNLATIEDIEHITAKVEAIKTDFIRETEKIKIELQYTNQIKFSLKTEEIKSLIDFYEKYYLWLNILLDTYFSEINEDNRTVLKNIVSLINDSYFKFLLAEAKMELFTDDEELKKHTITMKLETLKLQNFILKTSDEINILLFQVTVMESETPLDHQEAEYQKLLDRKKELLDNYRNGKLERYRVIAPMNNTFQKLTYKLLGSLTKTANNEV